MTHQLRKFQHPVRATVSQKGKKNDLPYLVVALKIALGRPVVKIPKSKTADDHLLLDLGEIVVSSEYFATESSYSEYVVSVKNLELRGNCYNEGNLKSYVYLQNVFLDLKAKVWTDPLSKLFSEIFPKYSPIFRN